MVYDLNLDLKLPLLPTATNKLHFAEQQRIFDAIRKIATGMSTYYTPEIVAAGNTIHEHGTVYVKARTDLLAFRGINFVWNATTKELEARYAYNGETVDLLYNDRYKMKPFGISLEDTPAGNFVPVRMVGTIENVPTSLNLVSGNIVYVQAGSSGILNDDMSHELPSGTTGWFAATVGLMLDATTLFVDLFAPRVVRTRNSY